MKEYEVDESYDSTGCIAIASVLYIWFINFVKKPISNDFVEKSKRVTSTKPENIFIEKKLSKWEKL